MKQPDAALKRIDEHIAKIEGIIAALLDGLDMNELSADQRLTNIARFLSLYQRAMVLRHTNKFVLPDTEKDLLMVSVMRTMRNEKLDQDPFLSIDEKLDQDQMLSVDEADDANY